MTAGVLAADPVALRSAAASLRGFAQSLEESSTTVAGSRDDGSWRGLAAFEQGARRAETASMLRSLGDPLRGVALGLDRVAVVAEDAGDRVRRHRRALDDVDHERAALRAAGPPPEPVGAQGWQARLRALEDERLRLEGLVARAREEFAEVQRAVATSIERQLGAELYALVGTLALLHETARRGERGWRGVRVTTAAFYAVHRLHRMRVPGGERTLHLVSQRVRDAVERLDRQPPGWVARVPVAGRRVAAVAAKGAPLLVLVDAVPRMVDGGGHAGARGVTTRVLAGLAVAGVVAVVVVPTATAGVPLVAAAAVGAGAYQVWMGASWAYDHRHQLGRVAGRTWSTAKDVAARGWSAGRGLADRTVDRAADRARSGLERLRRRWSLPSPGQALAGVLP
ncbi:hypothetical protein [Ornithinimicrobium cerasi]|uniref:hypothetical protein n=1 Tax=Ornithinimicrobium cerasi TaxID=2248773 RepID=UPI00137B3E28|nr:hypothetical protein [Ornithinimicrobium cerasi]